MNKFILVLILLSLSVTGPSYGQTKTTQKEVFLAAYTNSKSLVASKDFLFIGELVYNGTKREKLESALNTIRLNTSKITGQLTALGDRTKIFDINGKIKRYKTLYDDKNQKISIDFVVKGHKVHIAVMPNGKALLTTSLANASSMTWLGKLVKL
jgi:hypothetical protein